jgi:hypothetical protein
MAHAPWPTECPLLTVATTEKDLGLLGSLVEKSKQRVGFDIFNLTGDQLVSTPVRHNNDIKWHFEIFNKTPLLLNREKPTAHSSHH